MDNEMIERCAKAAYEERYPNLQYDYLFDYEKNKLKLAQMAVIKAMREPTEKIKTIKTMSIDYSSEEIWQSFINAIIGEE